MLTVHNFVRCKKAMETRVNQQRDLLDAAVEAEDHAAVLTCLENLEQVDMTVELLETTKVGKALAAVKGSVTFEGKPAHERAKRLLKSWKHLVKKRQAAADGGAPPSKRSKVASSGSAAPVHRDVGKYRALFHKQGKQGKDCKDPPMPPPCEIQVLAPQSTMVREADGTLYAADFPTFRPNLTPDEVRPTLKVFGSLSQTLNCP